MRTVFFGTPTIAANILNYLIEHKIPVNAVITKPDRPKGRSGDPIPTPVKLIAQQYNIPVYQPEIVSALDFAPTLEKYQADLFIVVAYGEIIKQHLLDMPKLACINMHASLLPKYRGAAPIQRCIINGEKESGVTIMHMVKKMDAGDMIKIVKVPIGPNMNAGELEEELCKVGSVALLDVVHEFEKGTATRVPQDHSLATLAPKIELEDCEIHWNNTAQNLHNLVRGATPHPGAWCFVKVREQQKRLKLIETRVVEDQKGAPGTILGIDKEGLTVACQVGALKILTLQLEGKKAMASEELMRGIPLDQFHFNREPLA